MGLNDDPLSLVTRPPICLSQSRIKPLWLCPHNFIETYGLSGENADYGNDGSEDANVGIVLHALDAKYCEHCWQQKRKSDWVYLKKLADEAMELLPKHRRDKAMNVVAKIQDSTLIDLRAQDAQFEKRHALRWPEFTRCEVGEPVDRLEGTFDKLFLYPGRAVLRDLKAGYSRHAGQFDEDVFDDLQMLTYSFMVFQLYPDVQQVDAWLDFMAFGGNNHASGTWTRETIETFEFDWYPEKFDLGPLTIRKLLNLSFERAASLTSFPADGHWDVCRWCRLVCPKWQSIKEKYSG